MKIHEWKTRLNSPKYQNQTPSVLSHQLLEHAHSQQGILLLAIPRTPMENYISLGLF